MGETPKVHGSAQFLQKQNTMAMRIGLPFADRYYLLRERKKIAKLVEEGKDTEATVIRERLLRRYQGGLENQYYSGLFTRDHTPEERRFAIEIRRRMDLKRPSDP